jgi:hypothetical protein
MMVMPPVTDPLYRTLFLHAKQGCIDSHVIDSCASVALLRSHEQIVLNSLGVPCALRI